MSQQYEYRPRLPARPGRFPLSPTPTPTPSPSPVSFTRQPPPTPISFTRQPPPTPSILQQHAAEETVTEITVSDVDMDSAPLTPAGTWTSQTRTDNDSDESNINMNNRAVPNIYDFKPKMNGGKVRGSAWAQAVAETQWRPTNTGNNTKVEEEQTLYNETAPSMEKNGGNDVRLAVVPLEVDSNTVSKSPYFKELNNSTTQKPKEAAYIPGFLKWCVSCDNMCCNKNRNPELPKCPGSPYFQCCNCCCCFMICHYRVVRLFIAAVILFLIFYFIWVIIQLTTLVQTQNNSAVAVNTISINAANILQPQIPATANAAITISALWPISLDGLNIQLATKTATPMNLGTITLLNTGLMLTKGTNNIVLNLAYTPPAGANAATAINILLTFLKDIVNGVNPVTAISFTSTVSVSSTALLFAPIKQTVTPANGVNIGNTKFNIQFPT